MYRSDVLPRNGDRVTHSIGYRVDFVISSRARERANKVHVCMRTEMCIRARSFFVELDWNLLCTRRARSGSLSSSINVFQTREVQIGN